MIIGQSSPIARATRIALLAAGTTLASYPAHAQITGRFTGDVSVKTGYASNPFLSVGDDTGSFYGELAFMPRYILTEPTASTEFQGNVRLTEYLDNYGASENYALSANHRRQLGQFTDADVSLQFDSSILGEQEILLGIPGEPDFPEPTDPTDPGLPPENPDLDLIGSASRSTQLGVNANLRHRFSSVDTVSIGGSASRTWYEVDTADDFRSYSGRLTYSRTISDRTTVGLSLSTNWINYDGNMADSTIYRPQVTYTRRLSSLLSLTLAAGAQFIRSENGGSDVNGFSGNFDLCRTSIRSSLCLTASRDTTASGIGGVREQTMAGVNYSYRLAEYDTLRASASYSNQGGGAGAVSRSEFISGDVTWERRLNERLLGGTSVAYRNIYGSGVSTSGDVNVQVFLRYSLGQLR